MKTVVLYDSVHGNTKKIAEAIAAGLPRGVVVATPGSVDQSSLAGADLIVIASPTLGGRPTPGMQSLIDGFQVGAAKVPHVATFDTRLSMKFAKLFGYAAQKMAAQLTGKGCTLKDEPQGFIVKGRAGPLADGEEARAKAWGQHLAG
jgi:flavodoxin I